MHGGAVVIGRHDSRSRRGLFALALALLLHAALLNSVLRQRPRLPPETPATAMLWLKLAPPRPRPTIAPKPVTPPIVVPVEPVRPRHKAAPAAVAAAAPPPPSIVVAEPAAEAPPARMSAEQIISIAKRDLGKIDKELRKEHPQAFGAAPDSAQQRLQKGFEEAHAMAPNKWYQAAKVEDITPPGDDARKIYRITGALGKRIACATRTRTKPTRARRMSASR